MNQPVAVSVTLPMDAIRRFCQHWQVTELALFGSVLRDDFRPDSDIDVLVQFREGTEWTLSKWMNMRDDLQALFNRPVDVLTRKSVETSPNYLRRKLILSSAQVIYHESRTV